MTKKKSNLGVALEAAGITAERYTIPYDPAKIAQETARLVADKLRGKVLFHHGTDFTEEQFDQRKDHHWEHYGLRRFVPLVDGDKDIAELQQSLLADLPRIVGNQFVAFANVPPAQKHGCTARVRHVSVRCQFEHGNGCIISTLDVFICLSGARNA